MVNVERNGATPFCALVSLVRKHLLYVLGYFYDSGYKFPFIHLLSLVENYIYTSKTLDQYIFLNRTLQHVNDPTLNTQLTKSNFLQFGLREKDSTRPSVMLGRGSFCEQIE